MPIDGPTGYAGDPGDLVQCGTGDAALQEHLDRGRDDGFNFSPGALVASLHTSMKVYNQPLVFRKLWARIELAREV
jgi:hypothetical protein